MVLDTDIEYVYPDSSPRQIIDIVSKKSTMSFGTRDSATLIDRFLNYRRVWASKKVGKRQEGGCSNQRIGDDGKGRGCMG